MEDESSPARGADTLHGLYAENYLLRVWFSYFYCNYSLSLCFICVYDSSLVPYLLLIWRQETVNLVMCFLSDFSHVRFVF